MRARVRRSNRDWVTARVHVRKGKSSNRHQRVQIVIRGNDFIHTVLELECNQAFKVCNEIVDQLEQPNGD